MAQDAIKDKKQPRTQKLEMFKSAYKKIQEKHGLPYFEFMNQNFEIENLCEAETELLLKRVRKQVMEKVSSGLRALEMFLNAQNAPLFIFSVVKSFSQTDKEILESLYNKFAEFEIEAFGLESVHNEQREAEFIKIVCATWKDVTADFDRIYHSMKVNYKKESKKHDKSYLG